MLTLMLFLGCGSPIDPNALYPGYSLSMVDGQLLPVPFGGEGTLLLAGGLAFRGENRPRIVEGGSEGTVSYTTLVRRPDQTTQHSIVELDYVVSDGVLHIDLCPPQAQCLVSTELVGPVVSRLSELVLTHYLAGNPGTVYRYSPALPE